MSSAKKTFRNEHESIIFDTLQYAKRAEKAGFSKQQAEFQAEEMANLISVQLATKNDLEYWANKLTIRFGSMLVIAVGVLAAVVKLS